MTVLLIILLILFLILSLKIKIIIEYKDEVALSVRIFGLTLRLLPMKKRRVKPMTAKEAEKIRIQRKKAEELKRKKAAEKAKKKAEQKRKAAEKKKREKEDPEARRKALEAKRRKKAESANLQENLDLVKKIVTFFVSRLFRHLRIDVTRIRIVIGSEEASKTALLYGVTVQAVAYILAFLDKISNLRGLEKRDIYIDTDFLSEEIKIDVKLAFSIRVWHIFHLAFGALRRLISNRLAVKRRVTAEQAAESSDASSQTRKNPT